MKKIPKSIKFLETEKFFQLFEKFIHVSYKGQRTKKDGQRIRSQTVDNYTYTLKLLRTFSTEKNFELRLYLVNHLTSSEMLRAKTYWSQFYQKFTDFMYNDLKFYDNYVGFNIKNVRIFMNFLNQEELLQVGSFHKQFHVPKEEIPIVVFTPTQLNYLIYNEEFHQKLPADLQIIKDIFVFGCTVALRYSDLMALKPFHLVKHENGHYLKVRSQKTGTDTLIKLPDYALNILKQYSKQKTTLLPTFSKGHFNLQLKRMAGYISQDEPMIKVRMRKGKTVPVYKNAEKRQHFTMKDHITTHTMRRTAITTMLHLGMPEPSVRKISGHAPGSKEFFKYVAFSQSYLDTETEKVFARLTEIAS